LLPVIHPILNDAGKNQSALQDSKLHHLDDAD
jgi:hypothetical protein